MASKIKCKFCNGTKFEKKGNKQICLKCGAKVKVDNNYGSHLIWTKTLGVLIGFILMLSLSLALSITQIFPTTSPFVTSNNSVQIEYNISAPDGLSEVKFNWDGTNYTLYDESLVLFMNFDNRSALGENDTHVKDLSMYGNNGTVVGGENVTFINGKYNTAISFLDKKRGKLNLSSQSLNQTFSSNQLTIVFWMKGGSGMADYINIWDWANVRLEKYGDGIYYSLKNATSSSSLQLGGLWSANVWNFIALTYDTNGSIKLYRAYPKITSTEGVSLYNTQYLGGNLNGSSGSLFTINSEYGLNASLDDFMIYNRTLTLDELNDIHHKSRLTKYDLQNWSFVSNQSLNYSTIYLNASNPTLNKDYFLCVANSSNSEICSSIRTITQTIPNKNLITNFTTSIKTLPSIGVFGANYNSMLLGSEPRTTAWLGANLQWQRVTVGLTSYMNTTNPSGVNFTGDYSSVANQMILNETKWGYEHEVNIFATIAGVPIWLMDNSTGLCNSYSAANCTSSNYTKYANIINDMYNQLTLNGTYDNLYLELLNEPVSWNVTKYVRHFNDTFNALKLINPNIILVPTSASLNTNYDSTTNWGKSMYGNLTADLSEYCGLHVYHNYYINGELLTELNLLNASNPNCQKIIIGEWSSAWLPDLGTNLNRTEELKANTGAFYVEGLNYVKPIDFIWFLFTTDYPYALNTYYPTRYDMYSPHAFNDTSWANVVGYYPPYNVTKSFAHLCPAGGQVFQSSSDDYTLKTVSCKLGTQYAFIGINTDTTSKNITMQGTGIADSDKAYLMDLSTGTLYLNNNSNDLGIKDSYDIVYLVTPAYSLSTTLNLTKTAPTGEVYNSSEVYYADGNGKFISALAMPINITIPSLTNSLIYNENGTRYGDSNINSNDGTIAVALTQNENYYVLDNYKLDENNPVVHTPLWFSQSTDTSKHIASNLTDPINLTVVFNVSGCANVDYIKYKSNTGAYSRTYTQSEYSCTDNIVTMSINGIEKATSSNELEIKYQYDENLYSICNNLSTGFSNLANLLSIIVLVIVAVIIIGMFESGRINFGGFIISSIIGLTLTAITNIFAVILIKAIC